MSSTCKSVKRLCVLLLLAGLVAVPAGAGATPIRVAVYDDMGARIREKAVKGAPQKGVMQALKEMPEVSAQYITDFRQATLDKFDVLVLCQTGYPDLYQPFNWVEVVRAWVEAGHGLYVTHDAVGYRRFPAIFPNIAVGTGNPYEDRKPFAREWCVAREHPLTERFNPQDRFKISFYDTITMDPKDRGTVVMRCVDMTVDTTLGEVATSGAPAVVCGEPGKGRYVANGACIGILAPDDKVFKPLGGELKLLKNSILWLAERDQGGKTGEDIGLGADFGPY